MWWLHSRQRSWKVESPISPTIILIATPQQCILDAKVWVPLLRMFGSELTVGAFYLFLVLLVGWLESLSTTVDLLLSCFAGDPRRFYQLVEDAPTTHEDEVGDYMSFRSGVGSCVICADWPREVPMKIVTSCFVCLLHDCFLVSRVFICGTRFLKYVVEPKSLYFCRYYHNIGRTRELLACWRSRRLLLLKPFYASVVVVKIKNNIPSYKFEKRPADVVI